MQFAVENFCSKLTPTKEALAKMSFLSRSKYSIYVILSKKKKKKKKIFLGKWPPRKEFWELAEMRFLCGSGYFMQFAAKKKKIFF